MSLALNNKSLFLQVHFSFPVQIKVYTGSSRPREGCVQRHQGCRWAVIKQKVDIMEQRSCRETQRCSILPFDPPATDTLQSLKLPSKPLIHFSSLSLLHTLTQSHTHTHTVQIPSHYPCVCLFSFFQQGRGWNAICLRQKRRGNRGKCHLITPPSASKLWSVSQNITNQHTQTHTKIFLLLTRLCKMKLWY